MQISMFDGAKPFKINKPIRLIELFGGYGSQSLALKYLGIPFEHYKLSEWAVKSIQAYKDLHFSEDNTDYSANLTDLEIVDFLDGRISSDYQTPMTREQITKHNGGEKWRRQVYNNMKATNNLGSIMAINGKDLEITDTDKYCYIMTYSFPCQDLSSAGKGKGMGRDSGTRSGLLWEVERMLKELSGYIPHRVKPNGKIFSATEWVDTYEPADTTKLPQVLLMENVPEVIGAKNIYHLAAWQAFLEKLGYKNKWECLNAKDKVIFGGIYYEHKAMDSRTGKEVDYSEVRLEFLLPYSPLLALLLGDTKVRKLKNDYDQEKAVTGATNKAKREKKYKF